MGGERAITLISELTYDKGYISLTSLNKPKVKPKVVVKWYESLLGCT